jgi:hypothetical protein
MANAFNKGAMPTNLGNFGGSTTQRAANATRPREKTNKSGRPYWADVYKPNELVPDNIRLVEGDYITQRPTTDGQLYEEHTGWIERVEHYHATFGRGGICSAGPHVFGDRQQRKPCHGCAIYWDAYEQNKATGQKNKGPISISPKYIFVAIDMGLFHKVPQVGKDGQYRMNKKGEPYMDWVKCPGMGCQNHNAQESRKGSIRPWPMSKAHFNCLLSYSDSIGTCCTTCGGRGVISTVSWHCGNPECGNMLFDMQNTTASMQQVLDIVNKPYHCPTCGVMMYPVEQISCANCAPSGMQPRRATFFDVDMQVKSVRTGDGNQTNLQVLATSNPKPIDPEFQDLLQYKPNLEVRFAPTPLKEQARIWHRQEDGAQPSAQSYVQNY